MPERPALKDGFAEPVLRSIAGVLSVTTAGLRTAAFLRD